MCKVRLPMWSLRSFSGSCALTHHADTSMLSPGRMSKSRSRNSQIYVPRYLNSPFSGESEELNWANSQQIFYFIFVVLFKREKSSGWGVRDLGSARFSMQCFYNIIKNVNGLQCHDPKYDELLLWIALVPSRIIIIRLICMSIQCQLRNHTEESRFFTSL